MLPTSSGPFRSVLLALSLAASACGSSASDAAAAGPPPGSAERHVARAAGDAAGDAAGGDTALVTGRGEALGAPSTSVVGPAGGTLASADGRLLLTVPAGALAEPTTITVQPITALAPHAVGTAYRLSPEGVRFARPVELTLAFTEEEAEGRSPAGFAIAYQDAAGRWVIPAGAAVDTAARRITVATDHFSDWEVVELYRVVPGDAVVRTGRRLDLAVERCAADDVDPSEGIVAQLLMWECRPIAGATGIRDWSVDGQVGGSPATGTVTQDGARTTYTAPGALPPNNPVTVGVEVPAPGTTKMLLVATVQVVQDCPAPVCAFVGRARVEDLVHENMWAVGAARVTWVFSHASGGTAVYVPRGTVTADFRHQHCPIKLSPPSHRFAAAPYTPTTQSLLRVEFTRTPPTYSGSGTTEWGAVQTWTCPQDQPQIYEGVGVTWFTGSGVAAENGTLLKGSVDEPGRRIRWHFRGQ